MTAVPAHVHRLLAALRAAGHEAYPVGGCVRDSLLGKEPADWDLCTGALPGEVERVLAGYRIIETGVRHGTVTALTEGGPVEITTFRTDGDYRDNRHPEQVRFVAKVEEDLARRDFTVNAMALGPDGAVIDPFGGRADLAAGIIRCVGEPTRRFREDGLRILRALRFAARLDFAVEPATAQSVLENRALLENIAAERVFSELRGLLTGPGAGRVLLGFAPVVFQVIPELAPAAGFDQKNPHHIHDVWTHTALAVDAAPPEPVLRLTMLLHDVAKPETFFADERGVGHFYGHAERGAEMAGAAASGLLAGGLRRPGQRDSGGRHPLGDPDRDGGADIGGASGGARPLLWGGKHGGERPGYTGPGRGGGAGGGPGAGSAAGRGAGWGAGKPAGRTAGPGPAAAGRGLQSAREGRIIYTTDFFRR